MMSEMLSTLRGIVASLKTARQREIDAPGSTGESIYTHDWRIRETEHLLTIESAMRMKLEQRIQRETL